jgi:hypothetical protein
MDKPQAKKVSEAAKTFAEGVAESYRAASERLTDDQPPASPRENDDPREERVNEAAREFAAALVESYRAVAGHSVEAQERGARLSQEFLARVITELGRQAESNRAMTGELSRQAQRQQEAYQEISREWANTYLNFLNSMFSYHRGSSERRERPPTG